MTTEEVKQWCEEEGVHFVSRSYGLTTTKPITLHSIFKVAQKVEADAIKYWPKTRPRDVE